MLRVTDEFGAIQSFANDAIELRIEGPAQIIGDDPFALVGGTGAIWLRAKEQPGRARLTASHPGWASSTLTSKLLQRSRKLSRTTTAIPRTLDGFTGEIAITGNPANGFVRRLWASFRGIQ
ncbi:MAG: hypothetical protein WAN65_09705 [Candidatus Sulfotelmatobacter sp.]